MDRCLAGYEFGGLDGTTGTQYYAAALRNADVYQWRFIYPVVSVVRAGVPDDSGLTGTSNGAGRLMISLSPAWPRHYLHFWSLLNEFPEANFDDYGPKDITSFSREMQRRKTAGELLYTATMALSKVGYIGVQPITERLAAFHGICFAASVQGTGIPKQAVQMVIDDLFALGIQKISASFFAHNERVRRFLVSLGAKEEGLLKSHTMQQGKAIDMRLMAIHRRSR